MLEIRDIDVAYDGIRVVEGVSFFIPPGPAGIGLVGESGSGKSTIARAVLGLAKPSAGEILLDGLPITHLRGRRRRPTQRRLQGVPQDPDGSLDPRQRVGAALKEMLAAHDIGPSRERAGRVIELLGEVGLAPEHARRFPHQLSGGQRQRVAIARALAVGPSYVVLDEPTSALDVTVQALIMKLIRTLRDDRGLSFLLISHNLAVVADLCSTVYVLYLGRLVEGGRTEAVLRSPAHPYTVALRSAVTDLTEQRLEGRVVLSGPPANTANVPSGCRFHPRCPLAIDRCAHEEPRLREVADRLVACHRAETVLGGAAELRGERSCNQP